MKKTAEQLEGFVKNKLRRGYPEGELKNELLAEGYPIEEIEKAIYNSPAGAGNRKKEGQGQPLWYFLCVGLLILGISFAAVKGLRFTSWGYPLIIAGLAGIVLRHLIPFLKNYNKK